jgi:glutamine amidotransferase
VFKGKVVRFAVDSTLKVPHMGWNNVHATHPFMQDGAYYYFVHSYHCVPADRSLVAATVDYGGEVCAAIAKDNLFACQFHPEKSQDAGAHLIESFLNGPAWS